MSDSRISGGSLPVREVTASFGLKDVRPDPAWELEYSDWLRSRHSPNILSEMFARFREGESEFDSLMRRALLRAVCRRVGNDLQVGPGVVLKHPETTEFSEGMLIDSDGAFAEEWSQRQRCPSHS